MGDRLGTAGVVLYFFCSRYVGCLGHLFNKTMPTFYLLEISQEIKKIKRNIPKISPEISRRYPQRQPVDIPEDIPGHILSFPAKYDWPYPAGKLRIWLVLSAIFWSYPEGIRGNNPDIFWRCNRKYPKILLEISRRYPGDKHRRYPQDIPGDIPDS